MASTDHLELRAKTSELIRSAKAFVGYTIADNVSQTRLEDFKIIIDYVQNLFLKAPIRQYAPLKKGKSMNIIEAVKTGKKVKRKDREKYCPPAKICFDGEHRLSQEDILAEDWEVVEEKITLTRSELIDKLNKFDFTDNEVDTEVVNSTGLNT